MVGGMIAPRRMRRKGKDISSVHCCRPPTASPILEIRIHIATTNESQHP